MLSWPNEDKEVSRRAVWFIRPRHRDDTAHVLDDPGSSGSVATHSFLQLRAPLLTRRKIAALDHEVLHDPAERRRIKRARRRKIKKISH